MPIQRSDHECVLLLSVGLLCSVKKAAVFKDKFEEFTSPPQRLGTKNHRILTNALSQLRNVLAGYTIGAKNISKYLSEMMNCLRDPRLPAQDFDVRALSRV